MDPLTQANPSPLGSPGCGAVLVYCRAGFENEAAAEVVDHAARIGVSGYVKAKPESGYLLFVGTHGPSKGLAGSLRLRDLVFARQIVFTPGAVATLPADDRVSPLVDEVRRLTERVSDVFLETPDTNDGRKLSIFIRKFSGHFSAELKRSGLMGGENDPRLHVFFLSSTAAYIGLTNPKDASPWLMGIPRLKMSRNAPSRSAMKLEEAFMVFLDRPEEQLRAEMTAVDLGAAPGGWTWQLVRRHVQTTSVDNGSLEPALMDSGLVTHLRCDGFRFRPPRAVDWLVCDIVEQPCRIAELMARWAASRLCRAAIFNLKLPMKKRYDELQRCRGIIEEQLEAASIGYSLQFKQLYHDRAEVTGYLKLLEP